MTTFVSVSVQSTVDPDWVNHVTGGTEGYGDVFARGYSGYWAYGVAHDPDLGWLAYEQGDDKRPTDAMCEDVEKAWRAGKDLPNGFLRFNLDMAKRAWAIGVQRYGECWFEDGDGPRYDCVLQIACGVTWEHDGKVDARYG